MKRLTPLVVAGYIGLKALVPSVEADVNATLMVNGFTSKYANSGTITRKVSMAELREKFNAYGPKIPIGLTISSDGNEYLVNCKIKASEAPDCYPPPEEEGPGPKEQRPVYIDITSVDGTKPITGQIPEDLDWEVVDLRKKKFISIQGNLCFNDDYVPDGKNYFCAQEIGIDAKVEYSHPDGRHKWLKCTLNALIVEQEDSQFANADSDNRLLENPDLQDLSLEDSVNLLSQPAK